MGIISSDIEFDYPAPKADIIVDKMSSISGLQVSIVSSFEDELHDLYISVAFEAFPDTHLEIFTYRPGSLNAFNEEFIKDGFDPNWSTPVHGTNEKSGKQNVYLRGYIGQEMTLFDAAIMALKELGGRSLRPTSGLENEYSFPISVEELKQRHLKLQKQNKMHWIIIVLLLPVTIPFIILKAIYGFLKMPFRLNRAYKEVIKRYPDKF